jgi:uncharacterized RDD family membrane protein YckC
MNYCGPGCRLAAFVVDVFVVLALYMLFGLILSLAVFTESILSLPMVGFWFYGGMSALSWIYFAGLESSSIQATVGKKLLGLKVTTISGKRIGFLRASVRYFGKILSRLIFMIGFLMIPFTKKKQGLHDMIAQTLVLK